MDQQKPGHRAPTARSSSGTFQAPGKGPGLHLPLCLQTLSPVCQFSCLCLPLPSQARPANSSCSSLCTGVGPLAAESHHPIRRTSWTPPSPAWTRSLDSKGSSRSSRATPAPGLQGSPSLGKPPSPDDAPWPRAVLPHIRKADGRPHGSASSSSARLCPARGFQDTPAGRAVGVGCLVPLTSAGPGPACWTAVHQEPGPTGFLPPSLPPSPAFSVSRVPALEGQVDACSPWGPPGTCTTPCSPQPQGMESSSVSTCPPAAPHQDGPPSRLHRAVDASGIPQPFPRRRGWDWEQSAGQARSVCKQRSSRLASPGTRLGHRASSCRADPAQASFTLKESQTSFPSGSAPG